MYFDTTYLIIGGVAALVSSLVRNRLLATMKQLSNIPTSSGLSGNQIARAMLQGHRINDVDIISVKGQLTDHYNPLKKTVNLSDWVYSPNSIAAASVAAHEVGHAIQHNTSYPLLQFRSGIVPLVNLSNRFAPFVIMAGFVVASIPEILLAGIIMFAFSTVFSLITLPVEFDASRRALAWLEESGTMRGEELAHARKGLRWAAMTYVVAALTSLATLLYYLRVYQQRR